MMLMAEVEKLRRELQQTQARIADLEQLADQDPLAPIANRRAFVRELSRMLSFAERYSTPSSIVYFDVNGLKTINDTYGHAAGDAVLGQVANTLTKNVRDSDYVARLGGDEFGVILTYTDADTAKGKADSLAQMISEQATPWKDQTLRVSARLRRLQLQGRRGRLARARGRGQSHVRPQAQQGDRPLLASQGLHFFRDPLQHRAVLGSPAERLARLGRAHAAVRAHRVDGRPLPHALIAASIGHGSGPLTLSALAIAAALSRKLASPFSTNRNVPAGALSSASR